MIALKKDYKQGVLLKISLSDDLWYLTHIISPRDILTAKTERKIKLGSPDGNTKVVKKTITLTIDVESVVLTEEGDAIRVKGKVLHGPEDVPKASYHTISLSVNDTFKLHKTSWPNYVKEKLDDALKNNSSTLLFVLFDKDQALFSLVKQSGIKHLAEQKVSSHKKQYSDSNSESINDFIVEQLNLYLNQYKPEFVVCASPSFWHKGLKEKLSDIQKKKVVFLESNNIHKSALNKLLSRPELNSLLSSHRLRKEEKFTQKILKHLDKNLVAYGLDDVNSASKIGAILEIGLTEKFLKSSKENNTYDSLDKLLKLIDSSKGKIFFLHEDSTTKVIDGLGGVAAVLRWEL